MAIESLVEKVKATREKIPQNTMDGFVNSASRMGLQPQKISEAIDAAIESRLLADAAHADGKEASLDEITSSIKTFLGNAIRKNAEAAFGKA